MKIIYYLIISLHVIYFVITAVILFIYLSAGYYLASL